MTNEICYVIIIIEVRALKRYVYFQPNKFDLKDEGSDCMIRALAKSENKDWDSTYEMLFMISRKYHYVFNDKRLFPSLFSELNYDKISIPVVKGHKRKTVLEFSKEHEEGIYVLQVAHHLVTVVNGQYFDTWDCGIKPIYCAYKKRM